MKKIITGAIIPFALCALLALSGCASSVESAESEAAQSVSASSGSDALNVVNLSSSGSLLETETLFSSRDLSSSYDESEAIYITLNGSSAVCSSDSVNVDGSVITITSGGVYIISGVLDDGQIIINAADTDKVQLVLDGASVSSSTSAAIYSLEADKLFITLAEGSENYLSNGGEYIAIDENNIDAVIFSKTDLTLNGSGSLEINAAAGHGIVSKDELVITGGTYVIVAADHGMTGKDCVSIAAGDITITSGGDGIHADNDDDATLGFIYIAGGSITIKAQGDAISASGSIQIEGGSFDLTTGDGGESVTLASDASGFGQRNSFSAAASASASDGSLKGIKADGAIEICGGDFVIDTEDDGIHAAGDITISDGDFLITTGDDGIHSDANVVISGGTFNIPYCYEGIEGSSITVNDGVFNIVSSDDGFNAADGSGSDFGGSSCYITINGGTITVVSDGDSLDSNGAITINGGVLNLTCNGNGNTALDAGGTYSNNGGTITTNDGSETSGGSMGGNMGGMQGGMGGGKR